MKKIISLFFIFIAAAAIYAQKKEFATPSVKDIKADSILEGNKFWYGPQNLNDRKDTSWCEGVSGDGIGQKVTITLWKESKIDTLFIKNGFGSPGDYITNNRVKEMRVKGDAGTAVITLKDMQELQEVKLNEPVTGKTLVLEILSVYKGTKYSDTCLTEVLFEKKNITPCENIGRFSYMKLYMDSGKHIELFGDGTLKGFVAVQNEVKMEGTWTRQGNKMRLKYLMDVYEGSGCGGMDPDSQGGCTRTQKDFSMELTIYNSCGIQGNDDYVKDVSEIRK